MSSSTVREKLEESKKTIGRILLAGMALALIGPEVEALQREVNRTRSIYVPVRFEACEHVSQVRLTVSGDPQVFTLGTRIFMFTYYPELDALLPEYAEVRIEGEASTDEGNHRLETNLLVTPERIVSSSDLLDRGKDEIVKQLRRRRDVRLPEILVHIKCQESCSRQSSADALPADTDAEEAADDPSIEEARG